MKLYLSSHQFGNDPEQLTSLALENRRAAIIMNATDDYAPDRRTDYVESNRSQLANLGFQATELDLRDYFGSPELLATTLDEYGLVWAVGGNSFVLRRAMAYSGFDRAATDRVGAGSLIYSGFSAGAVVAAPSLRGLELDDDPGAVPDGYEDAAIFEGLGLVDYSIAPHYRSDHPESAATEEVVRYFETAGMPYRTLRDGQAIVIDGDKSFIAG
jgi:dipeptidase E